MTMRDYPVQNTEKVTRQSTEMETITNSLNEVLSRAGEVMHSIRAKINRISNFPEQKESVPVPMPPINDFIGDIKYKISDLNKLVSELNVLDSHLSGII